MKSFVRDANDRNDVKIETAQYEGDTRHLPRKKSFYTGLISATKLQLCWTVNEQEEFQLV